EIPRAVARAELPAGGDEDVAGQLQPPPPDLLADDVGQRVVREPLALEELGRHPFPGRIPAGQPDDHEGMLYSTTSFGGSLFRTCTGGQISPAVLYPGRVEKSAQM